MACLSVKNTLPAGKMSVTYALQQGRQMRLPPFSQGKKPGVVLRPACLISDEKKGDGGDLVVEFCFLEHPG
jgi:hypothetical protein